jgi:hypothetical protein
MNCSRLLLAGLACALFVAGALAGTRELSGVKVEDTVALAGTTLALNGAGIRYKGPFKVYVGTLYTGKKVNSLDALVSAPGPKRLTMTMLREVESEAFGRLLTRGVEDNVPKSELSRLVPGLMRIGDIFAANKTLAPGESILVDWIPGTGMVVTAKNKVQGEPFKEPEFYRAIMSIWFGPVPADFKLKDALLGLPS